jgi:hypothetical protein
MNYKIKLFILTILITLINSVTFTKGTSVSIDTQVGGGQFPSITNLYYQGSYMTSYSVKNVSNYDLFYANGNIPNNLPIAAGTASKYTHSANYAINQNYPITVFQIYTTNATYIKGYIPFTPSPSTLSIATVSTVGFVDQNPSVTYLKVEQKVFVTYSNVGKIYGFTINSSGTTVTPTNSSNFYIDCGFTCPAVVVELASSKMALVYFNTNSGVTSIQYLTTSATNDTITVKVLPAATGQLRPCVTSGMNGLEIATVVLYSNKLMVYFYNNVGSTTGLVNTTFLTNSEPINPYIIETATSGLYAVSFTVGGYIYLDFCDSTGSQILPSGATSIQVDNATGPTQDYSQLISYTSNSLTYVVVTYNDNGHIKQWPFIMTSECDSNLTLNFSTQTTSANFFLNAVMPSTSIIFITLPSGALMNGGNTPSLGVVYSTNTFTYNAGSNTKDSFTYKYSKYDNVCSAFVSLCYISCKTCNSLGNSNTHSCTSCLSGNYPLLPTPTTTPYNCVSSAPAGYFYDTSTSPNNTYSACYQACATCNGPLGTSTDTKCVTCDTANGYYAIDDVAGQCVLNSSSLATYHRDDTIFKFLKCYTGCDSCSGVGIVSDMKCTSCTSSGQIYYPREGTVNFCNLSTDIISGFIFQTSSFLKCHNYCDSCTQPHGTDITQYCTNCASGHYPIIDTDNCADLQNTPVGYIFNNNAYVRCYQACKTCSNQSTDMYAQNCITCNTEYVKVNGDNTLCFKQTDNPNFYIYDSANNVFNKCYNSCNTCSTTGSDSQHNCLICKPSYYPLKDKPSNCYLSNTIVYNYFYDSSAQNFTNCYFSCKTCSMKGGDSDHKCLSCQTNFYNATGQPNNCFIKTSPVALYYFNSKTNLFEHCYDTCNTCTKSGTKDVNNCTTCLSSQGYYPTVDNTSMCNLKTTGIPGYYFDNTMFDKCNVRCKTCSKAGTDDNPNCDICLSIFDCEPCANYVYKLRCVDSCPSNTYAADNSKVCINCTPDQQKCCMAYWYQDKCISTCPSYTLPDSSRSSCYTCQEKDKVFLNGSCADECIAGYTNSNNICTKCSASDKYYLNGQCVEECPLGYSPDSNSFCQIIIPIYSIIF